MKIQIKKKIKKKKPNKNEFIMMKLSWWWIIKMNYHDKSGSWVCATDPSALSSDSVQKRGDTVSLSLRLKSRNRPECCVALLITSIHLWNNTDSIRLEIQWVRWPRYWIGRRPTAANSGQQRPTAANSGQRRSNDLFKTISIHRLD